MIKYVDGDLIRLASEGYFDVIGHCANCFCTMGSGIAPQIKNNFPEAYAVDLATVSGDINKLGTISHTITTVPTVVNLYGQYDYTGRRHNKMDLDYNALKSALQATKDKFSGKRFGFNKMGSGLAGGNWSVIERIIMDVFAGEYVTVVNYVP